jgi:hypothetical protein
MKPRVLAVAALAALLLLVPTAAHAKGVSAATISGGGPGGLPDGPITLKGNGEPGSGTDLGMLAEGTGVFLVMFEDDSEALPAAPTDRLGPRYTITWTMADDLGKNNKILQHVYPYAAGGPVTFMPPGQPVFDTNTTGGWYQGFDALRAQLIELGLPNRDPLTAPAPKATPKQTPSPSPATPEPTPATQTSPTSAWPARAGIAAGVLLIATGAAWALRRHSREATATR